MSFVWGPGSLGGGSSSSRYSLQARARQAREVKPDDDDVPASGAAGRRRRGRSVRGRVSSGWLELQRVRISVRKRVSSPTRIPTRQAATIRMYPAHTPADTGREGSCAPGCTSEMAFQRFSGRRQDRALATDDAYASSTSPLSTSAWAQAPSQMPEHTPPSVSLMISNARAHAALGLVNDLKCQSTRRPRSGRPRADSHSRRAGSRGRRGRQRPTKRRAPPLRPEGRADQQANPCPW